MGDRVVRRRRALPPDVALVLIVRGVGLLVKTITAFTLAHSFDGYSTNVPVKDLLGGRGMIAIAYDGKPIAPEHGGPVRLIIPQLYAWKSAKWVKGVRFLAEDQAGFWEEGGYHMRGNPWTSGDGERFRWS